MNEYTWDQSLDKINETWLLNPEDWSSLDHEDFTYAKFWLDKWNDIHTINLLIGMTNKSLMGTVLTWVTLALTRFYPLYSYQNVDPISWTHSCPMRSWLNQTWIHTTQGCFNINITNMALLFWIKFPPYIHASYKIWSWF